MDALPRRPFLVAGTGALVALAGCSGDGDTAGGDGTPTRPASLEITNPVLCTERPTGYREYTEQPDGTYAPGDVVWLYFEPSTTGTEAAGEGERRFEYEFTISVTGPGGESIGTVEDTASKTVAASSDFSRVFLSASFTPPTSFEQGTHTLTVTVTDTVAENTASTTVEFEVERDLERTAGEFGFGRFAFTENKVQSYREYQERTDAEYGTTEDVWYYYEIDGFAYTDAGDALRHELDLVETLTGPEGEVWFETDIPLTHEFSPDTDLDTYWVTDFVGPSDEWTPGTYELAFELTDGFRNETVTEAYTFTVVE
mgnify:CR=1 FL=1